MTSRPTAAYRLRELVSYRELISNLTARDLRLKYRRSTLGVAWSLLNPLLYMAIYTAVFSVFTRFVRMDQYWAFILTGLLPWLFIANALGSGTTAFTGNQNLVTKVYFPVEALAISATLANFVNFLISLALLVVTVVVAGRPLGPSLLLLPVVVVAELAVVMGLNLAIASLTVYLRDLEYLVSVVLQALFYLTPILYPLTQVGRYAFWLKLNPVTWYMEGYHSILYWGYWPDPRLFTAMLAFSLVVLCGGYAVFLRLRDRLPEEV
jgi:lipopolysaccharide transport system permease protein